jgi:prolyl-tRNA synthetase
MKWSQAFIPTLRDDPADAEAVSHKLLVRAGFIRQLMAGAYSLLPAGIRVRQHIVDIIREEMNTIGGQEFLLPAIHPADIWQASGRWDIDEMFHLKDRKGADLALGMTHEEIFTTVASELASYKQLPQIWYQIQTKFRDEPRPKAGLLRVREFTMKDSYSMDVDSAGLDVAFESHRAAYIRIFSRLGLDVIQVEASSGAMGGSDSVEFMAPSVIGEDVVVTSDCGYSANIEKAVSALDHMEDPRDIAPLERFPTPGVKTITDLVTFEGGAAADRQIKTLVFIADEVPVLALLRGDHDLQEQKLSDQLGVTMLRPASEDEIVDALGAHPGSLGAVGIQHLRIVADVALNGRSGMTTGANEDDFHCRNVSVDRDIVVNDWFDLRTVTQGDLCITCGEALTLQAAIEVGHIFKLGTKYSEALDAKILNENGKAVPVVMGSYGIGVERALASVVESSHDANGIIWPANLAPWDVVVTVVRPDDEPTMAVANRIYTELTAAGVEVILDDRKERPGVKFKDAELVGIPQRITVGPRGVEAGNVEWATRGTSEKRDVPINKAVGTLSEAISASKD